MNKFYVMNDKLRNDLHACDELKSFTRYIRRKMIFTNNQKWICKPTHRSCFKEHQNEQIDFVPIITPLADL